VTLDQLELFEPKPTTNGKRGPAVPPGNHGTNKRGGSLGHGPKGLLRALRAQGLDPDATLPAARLVACSTPSPWGGANERDSEGAVRQGHRPLRR
jgi:hypothetical protein